MGVQIDLSVEILSPDEGQEFIVTDSITCSSTHVVSFQGNLQPGDYFDCGAWLEDSTQSVYAVKANHFETPIAIQLYAWMHDLSIALPVPAMGGQHEVVSWSTGAYNEPIPTGIHVDTTRHFLVNAAPGGDPGGPPGEGGAMGLGGNSW